MEAKGLQVNVEKKIMRCRRRETTKKVVWKCGGREIEELRKFRYLGYVTMANGKQKEYIEERTKKGAMVMK